jgi:hypothetical protein
MSRILSIIIIILSSYLHKYLKYNGDKIELGNEKNDFSKNNSILDLNSVNIYTYF